MQLTLNNIKDVYKAKKASVETMELKGYELITELFCDSSGLGAPDEFALTQDQLESKLTELVTEHGQLTAKITNVGQFQCYVGLFKKTGKSKSRVIGNNTLEITYSNTKRAIRLHDTDIITFEPGKIILDCGGWKTRTTTARMNEYLPDGYVFRKNWELYANYKGQEYKFNGDSLVLES